MSETTSAANSGSTALLGWQPIATAPLDGTELLVWLDCASVPVVHIAWYRSRDEWEESGRHCGGWDTVEDWEGWWSYTRNSVSQEKLDGYAAPIYWMPYVPPNAGPQEELAVLLAAAPAVAVTAECVGRCTDPYKACTKCKADFKAWLAAAQDLPHE